MQPPKTEQQIQAMREGGKLLAQILADLRHQVHEGISGRELDVWVEKAIIQSGASATYKTPEVGFPGVICISVNEQIVHGIPTDYRLRKGDVVSFDLVITYKGMMTDAAFTMVVDEVPSGAVKNLLTTTERALYAGIDAIHRSSRTGDVGMAIEKVLDGGKLGVIRELVGHGVGTSMHMPPEQPNFGRKGEGVLLRPGDTIAIEPMATLGKERIVIEDDGWTISTADGSLAAHFEHTVLITESGAEILTAL
jgi:methionyl aminopeptidase